MLEEAPIMVRQLINDQHIPEHLALSGYGYKVLSAVNCKLQGAHGMWRVNKRLASVAPLWENCLCMAKMKCLESAYVPSSTGGSGSGSCPCLSDS